jgi:hypothetical protein
MATKRTFIHERVEDLKAALEQFEGKAGELGLEE